MDVEHPPFGDALGARGADEVLAQHLQHGAPGQPGDDSRGHHREGERRQDQVAQEVGKIATAVDGVHTARRQPAQLHREEQDQQQSEPEGRHGNADEDHERQDPVGPAVLPGRGPDANQQPPERAEHERRSRENQRRGEALPHFVEHRPVQAVGPPEVTAQKILEPDEVLLDERLVET